MKHTAYDFLFTAEAPHISMGPPEPESEHWIPSFFYTRPELDVCVRRLRGHKMRTYEDLMNEFAAALQFFSGFGENFNALDECLLDLGESLPADAYILVIDRAEELLAEEPDSALEALFDRLDFVGKEWSEPIVGNGRFDRDAKPFHTLLQHSATDTSAVRLLRVAKSAKPLAAEDSMTPSSVSVRVLNQDLYR